MDPLTSVSAVSAVRGPGRANWAPGGASGQPLPQTAPTPSGVALSAPAQLLEAVLAAPVPADSASARTTPLLSAPPASPGGVSDLAHALADTLQHSGLFYESHLAEWVRGEIPLSALDEEPQARLPALPAPAARPAGASSPLPGPAGPFTAGGRLPDDAPARSAEADDPSRAGQAQGWQQQVDPRSAALVQQQLLALDTQSVVWQGELWQGQPLRWETRRDPDPDGAGGHAGQTERSWSSTLRLGLPALGSLDAELQLSGSACSLRLRCPRAAVPTLRAALPALASALADAGLRPGRLQIRAVGDGDGD